jgi:[acyl-carrier-protein] S-malonyltransferase
MSSGAEFPGWPDSEPAQGMAVVAVPAGERIETYLTGHPRAHQAVWVGEAADGASTFVVVGGDADAMVALAEAHPAGIVTVLPDSNLAIHTPLREPFRAFLAPVLAELEFADPAIPLYAGLARQPLTTAAQVRDMFDRNSVEPVYLPHIHGGMVDAGVELAVIVSASIPPGLLRLPFPVVHVERPSDVEKVLSAIYELDVRFPEQGVAA